MTPSQRWVPSGALYGSHPIAAPRREVELSHVFWGKVEQKGSVRRGKRKKFQRNILKQNSICFAQNYKKKKKKKRKKIIGKA